MRLLLILAFVLGLTGAARAQETEIQGVIDNQIAAFLEDDFARAFTYASPDIQTIFGSSERFGQMVRQGYPMVWRPGEVRYLELREVAGALWQKVLIRDREGGVHLLDYKMEMGDGGWKIDGVQLLQMPEGTA